MTTRADQVWVQGDRVELQVAIINGAGVAIDITGWTLAARVGSRSVEALISGTVTITDAAGGLVSIVYASASTAQLRSGQEYYHQLRRTDTGAEATLITGRLAIINSLFV